MNLRCNQENKKIEVTSGGMIEVVDDIVLLKFSLYNYGNYYVFEEGMTWREWVDKGYDTQKEDSWRINIQGNYTYAGMFNLRYFEAPWNVLADDLIRADYTYDIDI